MNPKLCQILIAAGLLLLSYHLGSLQAQRLTSQRPILGAKNLEPPTDLDIDRFYDAVHAYTSAVKEAQDAARRVPPKPLDAPITREIRFGDNPSDFWRIYHSLTSKKEASETCRRERLSPDLGNSVQVAAIRKRDAARQAFGSHLLNWMPGRIGSPDESVTHALSLRLIDAELALCKDKNARVKVLEDHWAFLKLEEWIMRAKLEAGVIGPKWHNAAVYRRMKAEYELVKALAE